MFCPKCGNQNPDGSSFCSACGATFSAPVAAPVNNPIGAGGFASAGGAASLVKAFSPVQIVAVIAVVLALVFSLLPWATPSSGLVGYSTLNYYGGELSSAITGLTNTAKVSDQAYSVFSFPAYASSIDSYKSAMNSVSSALDSLSSSGRARAVPLAEPQYSSGGPGVSLYVTMIAWVVSAILIVIGLIQTIASRGAKGSVILIAGSAILALFSLIWAFGLYPGLVSGGYASSGGANNAIFCGILSIVCLVCSILSRKAAKA